MDQRNMTDRKALAAALELVHAEPKYRDFIGAETRHQAVELILSAATRNLAQLPEKCPVPVDKFGFCEVCKNTGKVYPPALVAYLLTAAPNLTKQQIEALLDALNTIEVDPDWATIAQKNRAKPGYTGPYPNSDPAPGETP